MSRLESVANRIALEDLPLSSNAVTTDAAGMSLGDIDFRMFASSPQDLVNTLNSIGTGMPTNLQDLSTSLNPSDQILYFATAFGTPDTSVSGTEIASLNEMTQESIANGELSPELASFGGNATTDAVLPEGQDVDPAAGQTANPEDLQAMAAAATMPYVGTSVFDLRPFGLTPEAAGFMNPANFGDLMQQMQANGIMNTFNTPGLMMLSDPTLLLTGLSPDDTGDGAGGNSLFAEVSAFLEDPLGNGQSLESVLVEGSATVEADSD